MKTMSRFFRKPCFFQKTVCLLWAVCAVLLVSLNLYAAEPAVQASGVNFTSVTDISMTVNWIRGDGDSCIVLMKAASAVDANPADGTGYTADAVFRYGSQVGTGNCAVYSGTGTSVNVIGLNPFTVYYVAVYEFNGSGGTEDYLTPGAVSSTSTIDNRVWSSVFGNPGMDNNVLALAVDGSGNLYAGGGFSTAGGVSAGRIAKWDGSVWSALGSGMDNNVLALAVDGSGNLYAGGSFSTAGGVSAMRIAKWDGSAWSGVGGGMGDFVNALAFDGSGNLYAGGNFTSSDGVSVWDGSAWSVLGTGANKPIYALAVDSSGNLYAGGDIIDIGGVSVNNIAQWDGLTWSDMSGGMSNRVYALEADSSGNLYAGGKFNDAGGVTVSFIAKWDGSAWSGLGGGVGNFVHALAVDGRGNLYAGGEFTTAGVVSASYIAKWNGSAWSALGTGMNGIVNTLAVDSAGNLYAGGGFTTAGGMISNYIARYNSVPASEPGTQASSVNFTSITGTSLTVNWTRGTGAECIVVMRPGSAVDSDPADWTTYTANTVFSSGDEIGTGNYAVYKGIGNTVTVTGLSEGTTYYAAVYEFNGYGGSENYLIVPAINSTTTTGCNCANTVVTGIPQAECEALVALYNSTAGTGWTDSSNWNTTSLCDNWFGVTVSAGHVAQIDLNTNNLVGTIPAELGNLSSLANLFLHSNQLSGSIPPELGNLSSLGTLYLHSNQLSGSIPASLGNLSSLVTLYLHSNQLSGSIPAELGNLSSLQILSLGSNQLSGSIPAELGNLSSLQYLYLHVNQLTGSIPATLGNLSNLQYLALYNNQLSGSIPAELGNLSNLSTLDLNSNQLSGSIPAELGNLSSLQELVLNYNQFLSGSIPAALGNLSSLQNLYLSGNQLSGSIPAELGNLSSLQYLALSYNQLSGSIPPELGNLSSLNYLSLNRNQLSSSIPSALGNLTGLQYLWLDGNQLSGDIPATLTNMISLDPANTNLGYNSLTASDPGLITFLSTKDSDWATTQTVPPTNLGTADITANSIRVTWTPILYTADGGYYRVKYAAMPGGPYTDAGTTVNKSAADFTVTGLLPGSTYYFAVETYTPVHGLNTNALTSALSPEISAATLTAEPTTQATTVTFTAVDATSMTLNWINGSGTNRIVLMKAGSAVDANPADGTGYTANAAFGSGTQIGTGNYAVYSGTGSTVTVTGLTAGTTYYFAVYEFNGTGGTENYLTSIAPASGYNTACYTNITVTSTADSGPGSLRQAITDICDGGTITFSPGLTITLSSTLSLINPTKSFTIDGTGSSPTISGNDAVGVFSFAGGNSSYTITLKGLHITHGNPGITIGPVTDNGPMAYYRIENCIIDYCSSGGSGAAAHIRAEQGHDYVIFSDCIIKNNTAPGVGAAMFFVNYGSMINCLITDNTGTGVEVYHSCQLINCTVANNSAYEINATGYAIYGGTLIYNTLIYAAHDNFMSLWEDGGSGIIMDRCAINGSYTYSISNGSPVITNMISLSADPFNGVNDYTLNTTADGGLMCINTGDNSYNTQPTDLAANPRIQNSMIDIGAYESAFTLVPEPITQASGVNFASVTGTSMTVNWTNGNGSNRIVLIRAGSPVDANPADCTIYTADAAFGSGTQIGTGNYVVYNGTGNTVTVTGLTEGTTYYVAVYEFNGSGGTENYLTSIAPANGNTTTAMTPPGNALDFDGMNDYVDVSDNVYFSGDLTIEVWVYLKSYTNWSRLLDFGNGFDSDNILLAFIETTGKPSFRIYKGGILSYTDSIISVPLNTWTHLAATLSGTTGAIYINGVQVASNASMLTPNNINRTNCFIGRSNWAADSYVNAMFDEVRIWSSARTCAEINSTMNSELTGTEPGLVAYYNFNRGIAGGDNTGIPAPEVTDIKGTNHGTIVSFAKTGTASNFVASTISASGTTPAPQPEINVTGLGISIPDGDTAPATADDTDFGSADVGSGSVVHTFTVENKGTGDLILGAGSITVSGTDAADFTVSGITLPVTVTGGSSATFDVTFDPSALGLRTATVAVASNDCDENPYDFAVQGTGGNTAPVINLDPDNSLGGLDDGNNEVIFTEGGSAGAVADSDAAVTDTENAVSLTLTVTGIADGLDEIFAIAATDFPQNADKTADVTAGATTFTVVYTQSTGVFLITGQGGTEMPLADLNILIRGITYQHLSAAPVAGNRSLSFMANDGFADSLSVLSVITVTPVNNAPVITGQTVLSVNEDTALVIQLTDLTVTDLDNTYPTGFTLTVQTGTDYTVSGTEITPAANFNGTLTVPVLVNDGANDSNIYNLSVTVNAVNDVPEITGQTVLSVNEDTPLVIQLTDLTVTDLDNTYPTGFTLTVQTGTDYTVSGTEITPAANFTGSLTVPVLVNDGANDSNIFDLTVTVNAVNDAPEITGHNPMSVNEDTALVIQLTDLTVTDLDNTYPAGFTLTVQTGTDYTVSGTQITPSENFTGTLTVPVLVNDGANDSNVFNLTVTVNAVNDAPVITGQTVLSVNEDTPLVIQLTDLTVTDLDNIYPTGFTLTVLTGTDYTVSGTEITPDANFNGTLTVPVLVNDGTDDSAVFNLTVTVNAVNDVPEITGQNAISIPEETPLTIAAGFLTVSDPDNIWPDDFTITAGDGLNYTRTGNTITPNPDFTGDLTVPVTVNDGTADSIIFPFVITVTALNIPVITGQNSLTTAEDTPLTLTLNDLTVSDPDSAWPADFTLIVQAGTNYTVSGTQITPSADFTGNLSVPVRVNDGTNDSSVFNVSITVTPINDAPVLDNTGDMTLTAIDEDTADADNPGTTVADIFLSAGSDTVTDSDTGAAEGIAVTSADAGSGQWQYDIGAGFTSFLAVTETAALLLADTAKIRFVPDPDFDGTAAFVFRAWDQTFGTEGMQADVSVNGGITAFSAETETVSVTVNPVNDAPVITGQNAVSIPEGSSLTITAGFLTVTDADNVWPDDFTITAGDGDNYTRIGNTVTPNPGFTGDLTVPVTVNDGSADSDVSEFFITVTAGSHSPLITGQNPLSVNEDTALVIQLTDLLVTDPDNAYPAGFSLTVQSGTNYTVSGNVITPAANYSGTLTVKVMVNDGANDSNVYNLSVTVNPVNDAPVITGQISVSTPENTAVEIQLSDLTVSDPDNDYPAGFSLTVLPGINYTVSGTQITPAEGFSGSLKVDVMVNDGANDSNVYSLTVTVGAVNDAPVITGQISVSTAEETPLAIQLTDLIVTDSDNAYPAGFSLTVQFGTNYTVSGNIITPAANYSGSLTVPVMVNDGANDSNLYNLSVTVNAVNDAPVITGQISVSTAENTAFTVQLSHLTVSDPDNAYPSGFSLIVLPGDNYTVSGTQITPNRDFSGILTVSVKVNDGTADSAVFPFKITVTEKNDAPVIAGQYPLSTAEDSSIWISLNDLMVYDPDSDWPGDFSLNIYSGIGYTVLGTVITPDLNFNGILTVPVSVSDGEKESNVFYLSITVTPVNDAPVIAGQNPLSTAEDTAITIQVSDLIVNDPDDYSFTLNVQPGANYTVSGNTITPDREFSGVLGIPVSVSDGKLSSEVFLLSVQVSGTDDAPVITGSGSLSMAEESSLTISLNDFTVDDPDSTYPEGFTLTVLPGDNYTVSGNTITPVKDFYGILNVPVTVHDGKNSSTVFMLSVTVTNVNDQPQFTSEPVTAGTEDVPYRYEITFTDADPEDSFTLTAGNLPAWLTLKDRVLSGTPGNDDTGEYEITLTVADSTGMTVRQFFVLAVAPVNDAPVIIAHNTLSTAEVMPLTLTFNDLIVEDPDSIYPEEFTFTLYPGDNYTVEGHTVTPVSGFIGTLTVRVSVNDGDDESPVYAVTVNVTERPEIRSISGTVTGLEKDREIFINAVSRSLNEYKYIILKGTGEQVIPYSIKELKPAKDYRAEISSTDYAYQVYNAKEDWEQADEIDISENSAVGVDFVLPQPTGEISGRIIFPDTARAGQSVLIRAYSASTGSSGTAEIMLEENGAWEVAYKVSRLVYANDYTVSLSSDSYLTRYYNGDGGHGSAEEKNAVLVSTRNPDAPEVNFVPESGAVISGTFTGASVSGLRVEAWSDSLDSGSGAFVSADGTYVISGLDRADDFRISVIRSEGPTVYYHQDGPVYDRNRAAYVSTLTGNASGIDIAMPEEKSISGTVRDSVGNPFSGIWVEAQSASQGAGGSTFSSADGTYEIQGLPLLSDYRVTARPDRHTLYAPQQINSIAAGTGNNDFALGARQVFRIRGLILDMHGEPVPNVRVEISSDSLDIFVTSTDDMSGMGDLHIPNEYDIDGLPVADDYTVTARPPADSRFAVFTRTGISIQEDTDMNIVLAQGFSMSGTVSDAARGSLVADARVIASSVSKSFRAETRTGADGSFAIGNMPESADYSLTVTAEGYTDTEMPNLSPSGNISIAVHSAGKISGTVTDENGSPLSGVPVEIFSQSMKSGDHFSGNVLTDYNGKFAVKGLRRYSDQGNAVADYTVIAYPENFPRAEAGNLRPDDTVNLKVIFSGELGGTVRNADGSLVEGAEVVIDIFEKQGAFVMTHDVHTDGSFSCTSLASDGIYELKFMVYSGEELLVSEWAGNGGTGVNDRADAAACTPGTPVHFRFSKTVQIPASRRRNAVHRAETSGETAVRNLRPVPLEVVYRDGSVTVKWEPSLHGENPEAGEKYYCMFGTDLGLLISKRTAPRNRPITVRTVTETGLTGDNADFHCHVAAVDARGQIGETRSVAFRTDTVAPLNPKISVPSSTKESTVPLSLAAAGAAEVYLSNITYGQGGQWEIWTPQREWKLTEGDGMKKIYGRFRDRAGNTVNAFAATEKVPDFDPATQHKVTVKAGSGGSADPSGVVIVNSGDDLTIAVKTDAGYGTDQVTVDGIPVRLNNNSQFSLVSIRADHVFEVNFKPLSEKTHSITATAGPYGSITPSGTVTVAEGADQKFLIAPVSGYAVAEVLVDGRPVTLNGDNAFVFRNVTAEHSISVTFK